MLDGVSFYHFGLLIDLLTEQPRVIENLCGKLSLGLFGHELKVIKMLVRDTHLLLNLLFNIRFSLAEKFVMLINPVYHEVLKYHFYFLVKSVHVDFFGQMRVVIAKIISHFVK